MAKSKEASRSNKTKDASAQETEIHPKRKVSDDAAFQLSSGAQHKKRKQSSANDTHETDDLLQSDVANAACDEQERVQTKRQKFVFGNYDAYYGYRTTDRWNDPRLSLFKRRWFEGKRCLDVGCNAGFVTISIAKRFNCSYILGIDIDSKLVAEAQRQLRLAKKSLQEKEEHTSTASSTHTDLAAVSTGQGHGKRGSLKPSNKHIVFDDEGDAHDVASNVNSTTKDGVPLTASSTSSTTQTTQSSSSTSTTSSASVSSSSSSTQQSVPLSTTASAMAFALLPRALMLKAKPTSKISSSLLASSNSTTTTPSPIPVSVLPVSTPLDNVYFMTENIVYSAPHDEPYDLIQCLSVTKWIHFNWGDEGIKRVFHKVFSMLKPRGRFLLEPQPWKSYKKKYALTETTKRNYRGIELRPDDFPKFLIEEVGFRSYETLHSADSGSKGFDRPIYLFRK